MRAIATLSVIRFDRGFLSDFPGWPSASRSHRAMRPHPAKLLSGLAVEAMTTGRRYGRR